MPVEVGKVVEGTVTGITNFGAFVQLPEGKTGLCHISEVADDYVKDISTYLKEQQKVKVKVIAIDPKGKISLSIRKAQPKPPKKTNPKPAAFDWKQREKDRQMSFEDKLLKFFKDSEEKQQQVRKHMKDSRRGNGFNRKGVAR
ncbi:S1 domain-containing RNA-binding protein [Crassaminicella indica]|uniref:RNA-binding protein S1 n=1 Tax=Crassaminicella indica TaxID=2855394 RepID=A0ABX8RDR9_9CLOT|nr:S1 domain-containing RNA-binding protein [Crassaminicella indica]QXM07234.1 RNA-binding protein S1 [Crassaminicella indica]